MTIKPTTLLTAGGILAYMVMYGISTGYIDQTICSTLAEEEKKQCSLSSTVASLAWPITLPYVITRQWEYDDVKAKDAS